MTPIPGDTIQLTDELRQSADPASPDPIAWYVPLFNSPYEYKICHERQDAEDEASRDIERSQVDDEQVRMIYPLYAGHGIEVTQ